LYDHAVTINRYAGIKELRYINPNKKCANIETQLKADFLLKQLTYVQIEPYHGTSCLHNEFLQVLSVYVVRFAAK
jgi:hypothetical protein